MYLKSGKKEECYGCGACNNVCSTSAITMEMDYEGFEYPVINKGKCVDCGLCYKVCPYADMSYFSKKEPNVYAMNNVDNQIRLNSSSGGVFHEIAKNAFGKNGVVFGVKLTPEFSAIHVVGERIEETTAMRGSKYIQSSIKQTFNEAKKYLETGRYVVFTGTPCQIHGLRMFLNKKYDNLLTVDLICHGPGSTKVFQKYIEFNEKKYKKKVSSYIFRSKKYNWTEDYCIEMVFSDGSFITQSGTKDGYMNAFLQNYCIRPACHHCKYTRIYRVSDITLADYWGVSKYHHELYDRLGTSLVLINTDIGANVLRYIQSQFVFLKSKLQYAINEQPCLSNPVKPNPFRKQFYYEFNKYGYGYVHEKYLSNNKVKKFIKRPGYFLKVIIRKMFVFLFVKELKVRS